MNTFIFISKYVWLGASVPALLLWLSLSCAPCSGWLEHCCRLGGTAVGGGRGWAFPATRREILTKIILLSFGLR